MEAGRQGSHPLLPRESGCDDTVPDLSEKAPGGEVPPSPPHRPHGVEDAQREIKQKEREGAKADIKKFEDEKNKYMINIENLKSAKKVALKLYISYIEAKMKLAKKYLKDVDIRFYSILKTTGEIKEDFIITYKNKPLSDLSRSETVATALEFANMFNQISRGNFPIFIDDYESYADYDFIKEFRDICNPKWNIAIETTLNYSKEILDTLIDCVDYFIIDIKDLSKDVYKAYTSKDNVLVIENLKYIAKLQLQKNCIIKIPQIPNYNFEYQIEASISKMKQMGFYNIETFDYKIK